MGTCVSRPQGCVRGPPHAKRHRRRRRTRKAVSMETIDESGAMPDSANRQSFNNPTFQGSIDEDWFDSSMAMESDCDDDFVSVMDDALSPSRDAIPDDGVPDRKNKSVRKSGSFSNSQSSGTSHSTIAILSVDDEDGGGDEGGILGNCGILPNNCLPCLTPTTPVTEKRSFTSSPPNSKKKAALRLSFKRRSGDGNAIPNLFSTKAFLERPVAGSQVPFCPLEKRLLDCWSRIEPSTFRVRGENYFRDKKKEFAANYAPYYPFGVDVYLCHQKIDHIGRFVELPNVNSSGKLPPILIVNVQVPFYPAAFFQNETDGEGMSVVLYFRLSDSCSKELPPVFLENIGRLLDDETERVRSFPMDTTVPFRDRLKILGRIANMDELPLNAAESKLMRAYSEKPVLSRPQHKFYLGENYLEIDLDIHSFSYIPRKGFETFLDRLKLCVLDVGLTIQGNKPEELPEQVLCCVQLKGIDFANYQQLAVHPNPEPWPN